MKRVLLSVGIILSLVSAPAFAGTLPDTGQTACYDNEAEIACPQPGEPFYGQDAQYEAAAMSYTKLGHGGVELPDNATEWIMVRDNVTGLEWENKTDNGTIHDKDNLYGWYNAEDIFFDQINIDNFGGHSDWRVPELKELAMLVDSSIPCPGPTIDTAYFMPSQAAHYWSKDHGDWLVEWGPSFVLVYAVDFSTGAARAILFMDFYNCPDPPQCPMIPHYARGVRGITSAASLVFNGDGTVNDVSTGLMWQQEASAQSYTWEQALAYAEGLDFAGYSDWRLPNRNELLSLLYHPDISRGLRLMLCEGAIWSSTTSACDPQQAWAIYVHAWEGGQSLGAWDKERHYGVLAVRGGQCGAFGDLDGDTICDNVDNCPEDYNPGQQDCDGDEIADACDNNTTDPDGDGVDALCDNCPIVGNPLQYDADADGHGDACDNCFSAPNGPDSGTCVKSIGGLLVGTGVTCADNSTCGDGICQRNQQDMDGNGIGDACECYGDISGSAGNPDSKVDAFDLLKMKQEFNRTGCTPETCSADVNADGKVDSFDLLIMKVQFNKTGCP